MYNRYMQQHGGGEERREPHPLPPPRAAESPTGGNSVGLKGLLSNFLGNRVEPGDLLLYLVLLLLYLEQEDEELLIVLAAMVVLGFSDQDTGSGRSKS